jgi:hypothetical protein
VFLFILDHLRKYSIADLIFEELSEGIQTIGFNAVH